MEVKIYEGEYPSQLKTRTEWNRLGRKTGQAHSNSYRTEKGTEVKLFLLEETTALSLSDSNSELIQWRAGLKAKETLTSKELEWIKQLEYQIKRRILESNLDKDYVSFETIYFNDEYPIERMGKRVEINRKGLKAKKVVGVYAHGNTCYRLYAVDYSTPLDLQKASKKERESWLEGLKSGQVVGIAESERIELMSMLEQSLGTPAKQKKKEENPMIEAIKTLVDQMATQRIYLNSFRELNLKLTELIYPYYLNCYGEKYVNFSDIEEALFAFMALKNLSKETVDEIKIQCQKNRYEPIVLNPKTTDPVEYVPVYYQEIVYVVPIFDDTEWEMRDGSRIRIKDMENSHIQNTIRMLKRNILADETAMKESKGRLMIDNSMRYEWIEILNYELKRRTV